MDIICFAQQSWDDCWLPKHHLVSRLVRRGHRVLNVEPGWERRGGPFNIAESVRGLKPDAGLREYAPGLFIYSIPYLPALGWRGNYRRFPRAVARMARKLGFQSPIALANAPRRSVELVNSVSAAARVYYVEDEWTTFGGYTPQAARRLREEENALLREVDLCLAVSPRLVRRLSLIQPRTHLLENAADAEHFSPRRLSEAEPHPEVAQLPRPRLGFVGHIDERLDQPLLVALARRCPDRPIVLAGRVKPGVDFSALHAEPNVHFLGYQPYENLPSVLREVDICLVPYRLTELTQSCWPVKTMEYLATGKPVVATPLESLLRLRGPVRLAVTHEEFIAAVEAALSAPDSGREERLAVAAENSWDHRVVELERRLEEAVDVAQRRTAAAATTGGPDKFRPNRMFRLLHATTRVAGRCYYMARLLRRFVRGRRPVAVQKILVARYGWLGDTIAILPMLAAIRKRYPRAWIVLGVQPGFSAGPIVDASGHVDEVRVLNHLTPPATRREALLGAWRLFREGFDLVISGAGFTVRREGFLSGAPLLAGLDDGHALQQYNTRCFPFDHGRHEAENNTALAELLGADVDLEERIPQVPLEPEAVRSAWQSLASKLGLADDDLIVTMHPGSAKPSRRWPAERFAELADQLLRRRPSLHVVFSGGPSERGLVESICSSIGPDLRHRAHNGAGVTDLTGVAALFERSAALVCNDTGVMHLARARGTPLVAVLGPENDWRWGPYPAGSAPAVALRQEVPCAPCTRRECDRLYCMRNIPTTDVLREVETLLESAQTPRQPADDRPAESKQLLAVTRRIGRASWADLANAGYELPLVSVVARLTCQRDVRPVVSAVVEQDYPSFELIAAVPEASAESISTELADADVPFRWRVVPVPESARPAGGRPPTVAAALRGDFAVEYEIGQPWPPGRLSDAVAALIRGGNGCLSPEALGNTFVPNASERMPRRRRPSAARPGAPQNEARVAAEAVR